MATFPTITRRTGLTIRPGDDGYTVTPLPGMAIRSEMEGGYTVTRARYTRVRYKYHVVLHRISTTNKNTLLAFEAARECGSESFTWTDHAGATKTVRYLGECTYTPLQGTDYGFWDVEFDLEEV